MTPFGTLDTPAAVTVTVNGQPAEVISSAASPGFVGLYQTAFRMPAGIPAGNRPVILRSGTRVSNTVSLAAR